MTEPINAASFKALLSGLASIKPAATPGVPRVMKTGTQEREETKPALKREKTPQ